MNIFNRYNAQTVWPVGYENPNQYIRFYQDFMLDKVDADSQIAISCDTNYALWLNGQFVHYGQFHDWQQEKTYDIFNVSSYLQTGKNVICVLVYYQGENSAQYICSEPGLTFAVISGKQSIVSGLETYWKSESCYRSKGVDRITLQLHFAFEYDSRNDDNWLGADYKLNSSWQRIVKDDIKNSASKKTFKQRPVKRTLVKERLDCQIITQGVFRQACAGKKLANQMQNAFLSYRDASEIFTANTGVFPAVIKKTSSDCDGVYLIVDLQKEQVGLFEMDIDIDAGTIIDIAYGEHLEDMRVRASIGMRNFANRYIAKQGRQQFSHYFTRFAGRYIQLHISGIKSDFTLYYAGLRNVEYPIQEKSNFQSGCQLQNAIYKTSVRTLKLSMHEHYEDCPWREQALYANDARNQALCGYYCFGEYAFPAASFDLLGKGIKSDGFLELCAPAEIPITIPSFSMAWIMAVGEYLLYSGDKAFATSQLPIIKQIIDARLCDLTDGVLPSPKGARYWHFYDWASGIDGTVLGDCTKFEDLQSVRFDAIFNLYFSLAMEKAAFVASNCGMADYAGELRLNVENLRKAIHRVFFDHKAGLYLTYTGDTKLPKHYAELTQSLAILANTCSTEEASIMRNKIADDNNEMTKTTLSQSLYKFEALLTDKPNYGNYVFDKITADWGGMLFKGATSFWETLKGASDFDNAGSLCHGWSAVPVYIYYAHLMGIRPTKPGFKEFVFEPTAMALDNHKADIITPSGTISVELQRVKGNVAGKVKHPRNLTILSNMKSDDIKISSY